MNEAAAYEWIQLNQLSSWTSSILDCVFMQIYDDIQTNFQSAVFRIIMQYHKDCIINITFEQYVCKFIDALALK